MNNNNINTDIIESWRIQRYRSIIINKYDQITIPIILKNIKNICDIIKNNYNINDKDNDNYKQPLNTLLFHVVRLIDKYNLTLDDIMEYELEFSYK